MKTSREKLLDEIEAFIARHDMLPSRLGRNALNNPGFVEDIRAGKDCTTGTADRIRAYMASYRPPKKHPKRAADRAAA